LIDFMFLVVVLLKQKLKLEFFGNNFKLWFDWFFCFCFVVETALKLLATSSSFSFDWFWFLVCCRDRFQSLA
jgi:hypothetical protein